MGFFNQRKPRRFNHQYIYVDERKERLREMEERVLRAKRDLEEASEKEKTTEERIRGKFVEQTSHLKRRQGKDSSAFSKSLLIILVLLLALLFVLLN